MIYVNLDLKIINRSRNTNSHKHQNKNTTVKQEAMVKTKKSIDKPVLRWQSSCGKNGG